jgi:hypothetical protein
MLQRFFILLMLSAQVFLLGNKILVLLHFSKHREAITEAYCHYDTHEEEAACQGVCYLNQALYDEDANSLMFLKKVLEQKDLIFYPITLVPLAVKVKSWRSQTAIIGRQFSYFRNLVFAIWRPPQ